jgi:hypothetical protein
MRELKTEKVISLNRDLVLPWSFKKTEIGYLYCSNWGRKKEWGMASRSQ